MTGLNKNGRDLVDGVNYTVKKFESSEETINTPRQLLAVAYESARNAVEFRSDHLIRQAAIVRILRRRLFLKQSSSEVASLLIKELIWAKYLKNNSVPVSKIAEVENIIDKYKIAFEVIKEKRKAIRRPKEDLDREKNMFNWLLDLAGCEIEERLVFNPFPQLLINFTTESLQPRINIVGKNDERFKDIQVYIAVERVFAKNSEIFITYHLLKGFYPKWFELKSEGTKEAFPRLLEAKVSIDSDLKNPIGNTIKKQVSKMVAPFNVLRESVIRNPKDFTEKIDKEEGFDSFIKSLLTELYSENRKKSTKAMVRSIIYILLTKVILGVALELPYDIFIGRTNYAALGINLVFPPLLMFLLNARITTPDDENTSMILSKIKEYLFSEKTGMAVNVGEKEKPRGAAYKILSFFYAIFFIGIFAGINYVLTMLDFNIVSKIIFVFFVCVVSFFAYRVKKLSKDYVYQEYKEGLLSSFIDFIFLPILKVGQWLSTEVAKLNFLGLVFDFIIEAPLKAFLESIEEWVRFVRAKKEEIFTE